MNLHGTIDDRFPRITLSLLGKSGEPLQITLVIDTGFQGEIAVPLSILQHAYTFSHAMRRIQPVNSAEQDAAYVKAILACEGDEQRIVEVLVLETGDSPLLGIDLLWDHLLTIEMTRDGEVALEPL